MEYFIEQKRRLRYDSTARISSHTVTGFNYMCPSKNFIFLQKSLFLKQSGQPGHFSGLPTDLDGEFNIYFQN